MKSRIIIMCEIACFMTFGAVNSLHSQQNITLAFTGKNTNSGMTQKMDSIQVKDLTRSFDTTLIGVQQLVLYSDSTTGVENPDLRVPNGIVLSKNFANPFMDKTSFYITTARATSITLDVFNVLGKKIIGSATQVEPGTHRFRFEGNALEPGVYFLIARVGPNQSTTKMLKIDGGGNMSPQLVYEGIVSGETASPIGFRKANNIGDDYRFVGFAPGFLPEAFSAKAERDTTYEFQFRNINTPPMITSFIADSYTNKAGYTVRYLVSVTDIEGNLSKVWIDFDGDGIFDDSTSVSGGNIVEHFNTVFTTRGNYLARARAMDDLGLVYEKKLAQPVVVTQDKYTISGTIMGSGFDVSGITVGDGTRTALTDKNGIYRIVNVPNGSYTITPVKTGFNFNPSSKVAVVIDSDAVNVNFSASKWPSVSGTITGIGIDVSGITVSDGFRNATTDSIGHYVISDVPNGTYTITPTKSGLRFDPSTRDVDVNNNDVAGIDYSASKVFTISGTIHGNGADVSRITVSDGTRRAITDSIGHYVISDVPSGRYTVEPTKYGLRIAPPSRLVDVYNNDVVNIDFSATKVFTINIWISGSRENVLGITVSDGTRSVTTDSIGLCAISDVPNGTYTITPTKSGLRFDPASQVVFVNNNDVAMIFFSAYKVFTISGTIACIDVDVSGIAVSDGINNAITDSTGHYVISEVRNGTYTIQPKKAGLSFKPSYLVAVVNNTDVDSMDFSASRVFKIYGTITGIGVSASGITVTDGTRSAITDSIGHYVISDVPNGTYTVKPTKSGLGFYPSSRVAIVNNADDINMDFSASISISGKISGNGFDVSGITVSDGARSAVTDSVGKYIIFNVPNGTYTIIPSKPGLLFTPASRSAVVKSASVLNIDFSAIKLSLITGTITGSGVDVSGIKVSDGTRYALTDNKGFYSISDVPNGSYTITPEKSGRIFNPASQTVTVSNTDVVQVDFSASNSVTVTDIDGNVYHTVTIGAQVWMLENLKTTRLNDGTQIQQVTYPSVWIVINTPGYCWYSNDSSTFKNTFGALYNWYTVGTGLLAPVGWHVPTDDDWTTLTTYLGGESTAGKKMKEAGSAHWSGGSTTDNSSGFTALPGGCRDDYFGAFYVVGLYGYWWSSTEYSAASAWYRELFYSNASVSRSNYGNGGNHNKTSGFSVRCVKD